MRQPIAVGTVYDGHRIVEVVEKDSEDSYQPYLYLLENGQTVWIPDPEVEEPPLFITEQGQEFIKKVQK